MVFAECEKKKGVKSKYRGQTGRSTHERTKEHFSNWENKTDDSPLWRHSVECHDMNVFPVEIYVGQVLWKANAENDNRSGDDRGNGGNRIVKQQERVWIRESTYN